MTTDPLTPEEREQAAPLTAEAIAGLLAEHVLGDTTVVGGELRDLCAADGCGHVNYDFDFHRGEFAHQAEVIARAQAGAAPSGEAQDAVTSLREARRVASQWTRDNCDAAEVVSLLDGAIDVLAEATVATRADTPAEVLERVAAWLRSWVGQHDGADMKDAGGRLHLVCGCGEALGISYGPSDKGSDDAEALAYFRHQARDLLADPDLSAALRGNKGSPSGASTG